MLLLGAMDKVASSCFAIIVAHQHGTQFQGGILLQRRGNATRTTIKIFQCLYWHVRMRTWDIFSNAEKFRCLYSYYGCCMPSSPKEYNYTPLALSCLHSGWHGGIGFLTKPI